MIQNNKKNYTDYRMTMAASFRVKKHSLSIQFNFYLSDC